MILCFIPSRQTEFLTVLNESAHGFALTLAHTHRPLNLGMSNNFRWMCPKIHTKRHTSVIKIDLRRIGNTWHEEERKEKKLPHTEYYFEMTSCCRRTLFKMHKSQYGNSIGLPEFLLLSVCVFVFVHFSFELIHLWIVGRLWCLDFSTYRKTHT